VRVAEAEDGEITAALAKLAAQDAGAADDAQAALEWIVGEQGLRLVTQERIQAFCWYELHAAAASGIQPPDLPEFEWGAAMAVQEASAWSATDEFLELAVVGGDLVPGARGWKTRQQELARRYLSTPRAELMGQTLAQAILTERTETWVNLRRSGTRRQILAAVANRLLHPAQLPADVAAHPLPRLSWLLGELDSGIALTQTGNLSQKFVQQAAARFGWDSARPPRTEDELHDLHKLRQLAQRLRLARRVRRTLMLTAAGRRLAADPERMWRAVAAGLLDGDDFTVFASELFLALLLGTGPVPGEEIKAAVGRAAGEEGFRESRTGEPPGEQDVSRAVHDTINLCRALGLLGAGGDWRDGSYELTGVGQATALEALHARATGPRTIPWP
jgi:hypothetical protein